MRPYGLLTKTLVMMLGLFGVTALVLSGFLSWSSDETLTAQFQRNGKDIAESIASISPDILLNRDPATMQAMIDERREGVPGISYILVLDDHGEVVAHTFVPKVPTEIRKLPRDSRQTLFQDVNVPGLGDAIDICTSILGGEEGYVHVGMDRADSAGDLAADPSAGSPYVGVVRHQRAGHFRLDAQGNLALEPSNGKCATAGRRGYLDRR